MPLTLEQYATTYLDGRIGYNARRAALAVISVFMERMRVYHLRPVDFSVASTRNLTEKPVAPT